MLHVSLPSLALECTSCGPGKGSRRQMERDYDGTKRENWVGEWRDWCGFGLCAVDEVIRPVVIAEHYNSYNLPQVTPGRSWCFPHNSGMERKITPLPLTITIFSK